MAQSSRWCFTLNNYNDESQGHICALFANEELVKYAVYGREVAPSTNTPHLQGFVVFQKRYRLGGVKDLFQPYGPHLEPARGTSQEASTYCKKDGDYEEFGSLPAQGQRNDFAEFKQWVLAQPSSPSSALVAQEYPNIWLKYPRVMEWIRLIYPHPVLELGEPRDWQRHLEGCLDQEPDGRKIIFVVDPNGGCGKSWFCRYWFTKHPNLTQLLSVGKRDDLAHCIQPTKRFFFFDCPRGQLEFFQYSVLEQLKNRVVFSPKYTSTTKILEHQPHVVVFTNEEPDRTKLTSDRYKIINIQTLV